MPARMLRATIVLALTLTLILVASASAEAAVWPTFNSGMRQIPAGEYFVVKNFIARADADVYYDIQVMNAPGPTVDILLMDKQNFELYKSGMPFSYYPGVSKLNVDTASNGTGVGGVINGIEYFLVIDNTNRPQGGAPGNLEVSVIYFFGGASIQTATDWGIILVILIVAAAAVIAIIVLAMMFLRKSSGKGQSELQTPYGQPSEQKGMRTCPNCGAQSPGGFAYCPRCGNRF